MRGWRRHDKKLEVPLPCGPEPILERSRRFDRYALILFTEYDENRHFEREIDLSRIAVEDQRPVSISVSERALCDAVWIPIDVGECLFKEMIPVALVQDPGECSERKAAGSHDHEMRHSWIALSEYRRDATALRRANQARDLTAPANDFVQRSTVFALPALRTCSSLRKPTAEKSHTGSGDTCLLRGIDLP
jgi:hypothetical protein